jgi:nucleoside-diphosphate-sugar epimerase
LGDITPTRDLLFVKDTARAFCAIAECDELVGQDCNIATQSEITVGDLAQSIINQINPDAKIITDEARLRPEKSEVFRLFGSKEKITQLTPWQPQFNLEQGIAATIEWFKNPSNLSQYKAHIYNL